MNETIFEHTTAGELAIKKDANSPKPNVPCGVSCQLETPGIGFQSERLARIDKNQSSGPMQRKSPIFDTDEGGRNRWVSIAKIAMRLPSQ